MSAGSRMPESPARNDGETPDSFVPCNAEAPGGEVGTARAPRTYARGGADGSPRVSHAGEGKPGRMLIVLGLALIVAAVALAGYNIWDSSRAGHASQQLLAQLDSADGAEEATASDGTPEAVVGGYSCIGVISIPSLNIELPVIADWGYEQLRVAPCRYSGSYLTDDLVICAHNYASHFGPLQSIAIGTDVYFESVDGRRMHYIVGNRESLQPADVEQMIDNENNSDSAADWDMTLFTCDYTGQVRTAVRCIEQ